jgi:NitT/TauT family transport system substrate-binding protein
MSFLLRSLWPVVFGFLLLTGAAQAADHVTVGIASTVSDAPVFIADSKGYFRDESLDVNIVTFRSATDMVPMLATDQADVVAGSASGGFYNAMLSGLKIRIVADKASSPPGYGATKVLVRKALVDNGRYKTPADLKGMTIALNAPGVSNTATLDALLHSVGLKYSDVQTVYLPLPDHIAALANGSVDASASVEPGPTLAIAAGSAVLVKSDDQILPYHETAVLLYSESFAHDRSDVAMRFMHAYLRAVRFYNSALKDGHFAGANANDVISILSSATALKNDKIYRTMTPPGINPDGRVNVASLQSDLAFYVKQGWAHGNMDLSRVVDESFADEAVKALGPYPK